MNPSEKITVTQLNYHGIMCPMILIGSTSDGGTIYVRYRWGYLSIRLDPRSTPPLDGAEGVRIYEAQVGGGYDGWIEYDDLRRVTDHLIIWPEHEPH